MGLSPLCVLSFALTVGAGPNPRSPIEPARPQPGGVIGAEDARFLDSLMEDFVFDPKRAAAFVRVEVQRRLSFRFRFDFDVQDSRTRDGWLVRGTNGESDRIYFVDGESMPVPATGVHEVDFVTGRVFGAPPPSGNELLKYVRTGAPDPLDDPPLVRAAWLHRLGYDKLAAQALDAARNAPGDDPILALRERLARMAADEVLAAFAAREDTEAVSHAARLFALYPDLADPTSQVAAVVADITRRGHKGISSRVPPAGPPPEFAGWDERKRIAFLIDSLEEVLSSDRWGGFDDDWRCTELYTIGDGAVPALIDAMEHDKRLTRQTDRMHQLLCCGNSIERRAEHVLSVRAVVERILQTILRTSDFDPTGPPGGGNEGAPADQAAQLRRYWAGYGSLPLPDRMMAILTDPASRSISRSLAAGVLAGLPEPAPSWSRGDRRLSPFSRPNPVAFRYARPSVAEAILAVMDQGRAERGPQAERDLVWARENCLGTLAELGDPRAGPALARQAAAEKDPIKRLRLAEAAYRLGKTGPLVELAREVAAGRLRLPPPGESTLEPQDILRRLLDEFLPVGVPETDDALFAIADPYHPYFLIAARAVLTEPQFRVGQNVWNRHPVCLAILRAGLADRRPIGHHAYRRGTDVEEASGGPPRVWTPPGGANPDDWLEHVEYTAAADAADRAGEMLIGLPKYHPLRRDADRVLVETRTLLARYGRHVRPMTWDEGERLKFNHSGTTFIPDIRPLGRPATANDVTAGRAVFALPGGRVADVKLPAWVILKGDRKADPLAGVVVQAEVGPDGKVVYGAIFRHAIRAVRADEVERIEPGEQR
jgi:hypothetical protein